MYKARSTCPYPLGIGRAGRLFRRPNATIAEANVPSHRKTASFFSRFIRPLEVAVRLDRRPKMRRGVMTEPATRMAQHAGNLSRLDAL